MNIGLKIFIICFVAMTDFFAAKMLLAKSPQINFKTRRIIMMSVVLSTFIVAVVLLFLVPGPAAAPTDASLSNFQIGF